MKHKLFKKAVLIIHGFAGGTYDEENLANYLQLNNSFDVYQFTLPGHKSNLSKIKHEEWINCCENKINWLLKSGYNKIYLIGHSMGGVIATYIASKYKEVKKLVLGAPAYNVLGLNSDDINIFNSIKEIPKLIKTYGKDEVVHRILKTNPDAIKEFLDLVKKYYNYPKEINCPVLILQGLEDNIVQTDSSKYVYDSIKSKMKKLVYINNANHDLFSIEEDNEIFKIVNEFLKFNVRGGIYKI